MKKLLATLLMSTFLFGLVGCGQADAPVTDAQDDVQAEAEVNVDNPDDVIIVGLDENFPPMGFRDENGELVGFDIDLAKRTGEILGMDVEFKPIDWDSKEMELETGKIDVIWNGLTITEERKESMLLSSPYLKNKQVILVKNGSEITDKSSLADKVVGLQKGSSALEAVESDPIKDSISDIVEYPDNVSAFLDLDIGRLDAVVVDEIVARYYIQENGVDLVVLDDYFTDEEYGIAAKKDNSELMSLIESALATMKDDGSAAEISEKWFGENIM